MKRPNFELQSEDDSYVCHDCIGEPYLKEETNREGFEETCNYCGEEQHCIRLSDLAPRVESVFWENYEIGDECDLYDDKDRRYTEQEGESFEIIVQNLLESNDGISNDEFVGNVIDYMKEHRSYDPKDPDSITFDEFFTEKYPDTYWVRKSWGDFKKTLKHERRFFLNDFEELLQSFFGDLLDKVNWDGELAIKVVIPKSSDIGCPGDKWSSFYRARHVKDTDEIGRVLKDPYNQLGPVPPKKATPGRMNPAGIPFIYGSENPETCLKELRMTTGERAVVVKYKLLHQIKVLDLTACERFYLENSPFNPKYLEEASQKSFLNSFHNEVSIPISEHDAPIDYLPTQVVAEFLSQKLGLDGMIFRSAQGEDDDEKNIVLFSHAIALEKPEDTWKELEFEYFPHEDGWENYSISFEKEIKNQVTQKDENKDPYLSIAQYKDIEPPVDPWIKLDLDSIEVHRVNPVQLSSIPFRCSYLEKKDEPEVKPENLDKLLL
jgi:hypothetical protein